MCVRAPCIRYLASRRKTRHASRRSVTFQLLALGECRMLAPSFPPMDDSHDPEHSGLALLDDLERVDADLYLRIRRVAARFVRPRINPTLNATAIANEVWIRLRKSRSDIRLADDSHFDALVGQTARFVTQDSARARLTQKRRGEPVPPAELDRLARQQASLDTLIHIDRALSALAHEDARTALVLRDHYFEGWTVAEISTNREISRRTVERALTFGRAWIHDWLTRAPSAET